MQPRQGFTLIEIMMYSAIFAVVSTLLIGILITVTRIQGQQSATAEVSSQANFVLQRIQQLVAASSAVDVTTQSGQTTLVLYRRDYGQYPTNITLSSGAITVQENNLTPVPITTGAVTVDNLTFTKYSNYPGHDTVKVGFSLSFNTQNPQQQLTRAFETAIARVSAATFDSNLLPGSDGAYDFGSAGTRWKSGTFSGTLGLGVPAPTEPIKLEADGGLQIFTSTTRPTCSASTRGTFWVVQSPAGVQDSVAVCAKSVADAYAWRTIY